MAEIKARFLDPEQDTEGLGGRTLIEASDIGIGSGLVDGHPRVTLNLWGEGVADGTFVGFQMDPEMARTISGNVLTLAAEVEELEKQMAAPN